MPAAVQQRLQSHRGAPTADIQRANPLGTVDLVGGEAQQVDSQAIDVHGDLAHRLGRVGVQEHASLLADPADLFQRLERADLVVGQHHGDQQRIVANGGGESSGRIRPASGSGPGSPARA